MKRTMVAGVTAAVVLASTMVLAQMKRPSPDQMAVRYREALMAVIGGNVGPLAAMGLGRMPYNAALARKDSTRLAFLATMIPDAFERDTSHAKVRTLALPKIWQDKTLFLSHAKKMADAADQLEAAVKGGADEATIKTAVDHVGSACEDCHKAFRRKVGR